MRAISFELVSSRDYCAFGKDVRRFFDKNTLETLAYTAKINDELVVHSAKPIPAEAMQTILNMAMADHRPLRKAV